MGSITAEFAGFELGLPRDIHLSRGHNKHVLVLPLKSIAESVTVGGDTPAGARPSKAFG